MITEKTKTQRGFNLITFTDAGGVECSLQKSSAADGDFIWLGADKIGLKAFYPFTYEPWRDVQEQSIAHCLGAKEVIANNRMHLSQEQVKELLPFLIKFVKTGDIN